MSAYATIVTRLVFPDQLNHHGTLFGGESLSMMASAAAICATRRARNAVVLAHSDAVDFTAPVASGSIAQATAAVARVGRTSLLIDATLHGEDLLSGARHPACHGRFVFVAVDEHGRPVEVRAHEGEPDARRAETSTTELVRPGQTNHHGTLFGGELMRLLDTVVFIAATRHVRLPLVTVQSERIDIEAPAAIGELVHLQAEVAETRLTSLVIEASAEAEQPISGLTRSCTRARFVMAPLRPRDGRGP